MTYLIDGIKCYSGVDSRPLAERSLAIKAGVGFVGKNSMVIKPGFGSYFFIGVVLTTHAFVPDAPLKKNCGKCRLCIDSCPTGAILKSAVIDATKCISYKTIERKAPLTVKEIAKCDGWIFGCDICQEVCPHNNQNLALTNWNEFLPSSGVGFDFFDKNAKNINKITIPKDSALYRSRKRVIENLRQAALQTNEH